MHGRTHIFGAKSPKNGEKAGFSPGFSSLKNPRRDFLEVPIIKNRICSMESLKSINGFGKQKCTKYGKAIVEIVESFFELKADKKS